jgi:hypothetical protein
MSETTAALGAGGGFSISILAGALAVGLAAVHLFGRRLRFLDGLPRSRWLSFSGGVSVAYVFVHLLPEIGAMGAHIGEQPIGIGFLERHVYLVALAGFLVYYGVERMAKTGASEVGADEGDETSETGETGEASGEAEGVFWLHVGSFAAYNLLVGYLLVHREESGVASLVSFGVAMALHFLVNDWGLYHHHGDAYHRWGRWLLAGAVLGGTAGGLLTHVDPGVLAALFAFLAGGVILNVIKEEVPAERESRFPAFAAGTVLYAAVLLLV